MLLQVILLSFVYAIYKLFVKQITYRKWRLAKLSLYNKPFRTWAGWIGWMWFGSSGWSSTPMPCSSGSSKFLSLHRLCRAAQTITIWLHESRHVEHGTFFSVVQFLSPLHISCVYVICNGNIDLYDCYHKKKKILQKSFALYYKPCCHYGFCLLWLIGHYINCTNNQTVQGGQKQALIIALVNS